MQTPRLIPGGSKRNDMTVSILVVDDDVALNNTIIAFLERSGHKAFMAISAEKAMEELSISLPDIVLTDISMAGMSGLELTRYIKQHYPSTEVMVMTGLGQDYSYENAITSGAIDFIFKPFGFKELNLRIKRVINEIQLKRENARMVKHLEALAITDYLTGLYNSRHFHQQLENEMERHARYSHPLSLLLFDIDYFKKYNDTWGHQEGDRVLTALGGATRDCLRSMDTAYRYGGEEFTVILPETTLRKACVVGDRIRKTFADYEFSPDGKNHISVTISVGVTQLSSDDTLETFVKRADMAMFQSKKAGRNKLTSLTAP